MFNIPHNSIVIRIGKIFFSLIALLILLSYVPEKHFVWAMLAIPFAIYYIVKFTKNSPAATEPITEQGTTPIPMAEKIEPPRAKVDNDKAIALFVIISFVNFFVAGLGLGAGWEIFFYGPFVFIGVILYITVFANHFKKYNATNLTIYTTLILAVFSFISLKLNTGIATDGEVPLYFFEFLFKVDSGNIPANGKALFSFLFNASLWFFVCVSLIIERCLIAVGYINKKFAIVIMTLSVLLPLIHVGYFISIMPELKAAKETSEREEKRAEVEREFTFFNKTPVLVKKATMIDRLYSFFIIDKQESKQDNACNYTESYFPKISDSYKITCSKKLGLYGSEYFPHATSTEMGINYPFDDLKKGDVIAMVVRMDASSYLRVNMNGNNVLKESYRLSPYIYDGIKERETIDDVTYHQKSVVQFSNMEDSKYLMILYPVNIDMPVATFNILIGMFEGAPNGSVEILELAKVTPASFEEPKWLNDWSKEPNPFWMRRM